MALEIRTGRDNKMYTLWHSSVTQECFIKNLSVDRDIAVQKAEEYAKSQNIALEDITDNDVDTIVYGEDVIRFGKYKDKRVSEVDSRYLHWVKKGANVEQFDPYSGYKYWRSLADEKLVQAAEKELVNRGELIEFEGKYITPKFKDHILLERKGKDHFLIAGERVELNLQVSRITWYDGYYGTTWIYTFKDSDGRYFTYKGSKVFGVQQDEWVVLKGTIEHSEYKGEKQTLIKRIKIIYRPESL